MKRTINILIVLLFCAAVITGCGQTAVTQDVTGSLAQMSDADLNNSETLNAIATVGTAAKSAEVFNIRAEGPTMLPSYSQTPVAKLTESTSVAPGSTASITIKPSQSPTPTPSVTASPSLTPDPSATPSETPTSTESKKPSSDILAGKIIGLDPGHQATQNSEKEPIAPGSSETKMKVTSGTEGVASGVPEHKVNLQVALKLKELLENAGATVVMTRESADVNISNAQRAQIFNDANVDLGIRLHCNGEDDSSLTGAFMLVPEDSPYKDQRREAAKIILDEYCQSTGLKNKGISVRADQTGFNWCERPIINLEMGHMSNAEEDKKLTNSAFQQDMAFGLYKGITQYFS